MERFILHTTSEHINNQEIECKETAITFRVIDYKNPIDEEIYIDDYEDVPLFLIVADDIQLTPFEFYLAITEGDNLPGTEDMYTLVKDVADFFCIRTGLKYSDKLIVISGNYLTGEGYDSGPVDDYC
jgi:hypothetical protein